MDANRFDELARTLAARSNRREAVRKGGMLAAVAGAFGLGGARAFAQDDADEQETTRCQIAFRSVVAVGPNEGATFEGLLTLRIGGDGAIDDGELETEGPRPYRVVGQAVGRAINLRVEIADDRVLALTGTGERDVRDCRGKLSGTFGGPEMGDLGTWQAERIRTATPTPAAGAGDDGDVVDDPANNGGSGSGSGGDSGRGGSDDPTAASTATPCAEEVCANPAQVWNPETCACECYGGGELCGEICCPVGGICDEAGGSCQCPTGTVLCGGACTAECPPGSTFDFNTCVCTEGCASGQILCNGTCAGPCAPDETLDAVTCLCVPPCPPSQRLCSGMCLDVVNDRTNCGSCGNICPPGMPCIAGSCTCPATTKYCPDITPNTPNPICKDENAIC